MKRTISLASILLFAVLLLPTAQPVRSGGMVAMPMTTETPVQLQNGTATFSSIINETTSPDQAVDGNFDSPNGWHIARVDAFDGTSSETAVWETATDLSADTFVFTMHFLHSNPGHLLGRFRFSATTDDRNAFADGLDAGGDVDANWIVLTNPTVSGPAGMTFTTLPDNSVLAGGTTAAQGIYTVTYTTSFTGISGIRLEALEHPSLPGGNGPGLFPRNGNFFLTELQLNATPSSCVPPPSELVGWWPGDGNAMDITGGNHGTLQNGATFAPGMVGQAFSFDGVNDFVQIPDTPTWFFATNDFTIDLWVNFRSLKIDNPLVSHDEGGGSTNKWIFWVTSNNLNFHINTSTGDSSGVSVPFAPLLNTWYHVTVTRSGATYTFYVNGTALGSAINPQPIPDANATLNIGRAESFYTDGLIDEVELFDRALTAGEIAAIFNAGSAGKCKNRAPMAICQNVTVAAGANCSANASIDNGSFDPDGDSFTLSQSPAGPYPLGNTSVTLTVTDSQGASSQCTAIVTVVDNTPPTITGASANPAMLWPPNHKMVAVTVNYNAADNCNSVNCALSVTSNEPINGTGDGDSAPDWEVIDAHHVRLRAERAGNGNGRIYTITITCVDAAGNTASQSVTVTVPHSM